MDIEKIESLIKKGNKMVTIKRYQELKNCSLRNVKVAVENFETHRHWDMTKIYENNDVDISEIKNLIINNRKIEAIKVYRQKTGAIHVSTESCFVI